MATSARERDPAVEEEFLGALYKGGELLASGKVVEAREHLEKANTLQPKNEKAQNLLGLTYFKLGLYEQASAVYERLVNENPADATLRVNLGLVYLKTNALDRCVKEFETATDLEPTHKKAHNYLGLALAQQGQYARAKEHFVLAGSDQMAEKMGRAIAAQGPVAAEAARTVVLSPPTASPPVSPPQAEAAQPPPLPVAHAGEEQPIEVMSDEEPPPDAETPAEELTVTSPPVSAPRLEGDWSRQVPAPPPSAPTVIVGEELPVLEGTVEVMPSEPLKEAPAPEVAPAWLTTEAAQAEASPSQGQWVTESVEGVPYTTQTPAPQAEATQTWDQSAAAQGADAQGQWTDQAQQADAQWAQSQQAAAEGWVQPTTPEAAALQPESAAWPAEAPAAGDAGWAPPGEQSGWTGQSAAEQWTTAEAQGSAQPSADGTWPAAEGPQTGWPAEAAPAGEPATQSEAASWGPGSAEQAPVEAGAMQAQADDASWATGTAEQAPVEAAAMQAQADEASWATGAAEAAPVEATALPAQGDEASWATGAAEAAPVEATALPAQAEDASWATGTAEAAPVEATVLPTQADDASWATGAAEAAPVEATALPTEADDASWATGVAEAAPVEATVLPAQADDASWATGAAEAAPVEAAAIPSQADDDSWATGQAQAATPEQAPAATDPRWSEQQPSGDLAARPDDESWAVGPPVAAIAPERVEAPIPPPAPSAPLHITVEEPVSEASAALARAPAGYTPMSPQRLGDLGASGAWVHEPSAGPFHVGPDGLAVTVNGEMLMRMDGLVAVVGGLEVKPETRRRRGRPTAEPFGEGAMQLQRVSGNGMVYLEPGKSTFHAVDLRDQNGIAVDDEGAYVREGLVFAFEEPISFENGRVSGEGQTIDLAHLKGNGRVLLQLDGNLRAMPIPTGAPMVVPLQRLVGWFGRVSPRLMGFGGRGAMELTGEGYALLGTPPERA